MSFSKTIISGEAGALTISETAGVATVKVEASQAVGGGSIAGVVKARVSAELDMDAHQLIDAGLELFMVKFPASAALVEGAKAIIDANIQKI